MSYNELRHREFDDFPLEYYYVDKNHHRYHMSSHWHTEIEIIKILDGELHINLNNTSDYIAGKNDIVFLNPETIHRAVPYECIYECVIFNAEFFSTAAVLKSFIDNILNHDYLIKEFFKYSFCEFFQIADKIFLSLSQNCLAGNFEAIGHIYSLFGIIVKNKLYTETNIHSAFLKDKNLPRLKNTLTYIRSNYDKQISLCDMAENAGLSTKHFCYFFKNMTGKTPVEYLNEYRVERSARKLIQLDSSITDIAYSCGFNDLSYFIKTFKKIKNVTPRNYRKNSL